jgi:hypothetical protein
MGAASEPVVKSGRGGKRPGAGRKPKEGRALVQPPAAPAAPPVAVPPPPDFGGGLIGIEYTDAKAAHEYWKAQLAEQEFKKRAGDLLDRAQVEQASATVLAAIAQTLRSIPDNLERIGGLAPEQAEAAERIIDSLCLSLHDKLRELGGW